MYCSFGPIRLIVLPLVLILFACTPLLRANDLHVCKDASSPTLTNDIFTFHITGGHLTNPVTITLTPGHCLDVAHGAYLTYSITEDAYDGTILTNVTATGSDNGVVKNGLVYPWHFPERSVVAKVYTGSTYVHFTNSPGQVSEPGRWTGGGSIFTSTGERVTHGFELHCDVTNLPNNLQINFGGNRFHLTTLGSATCYKTSSGVQVIVGSGTGTYNGNTGYTIHFTFTDAGEPGIHDFASYLITGPSSQTILNAAGFLTHGNHDYHAH